MDDREEIRIQMMGFLDDELDEESRRRFVARCYADPELAAELAQYRRLCDITQSMRLREPEDYEYERLFARVAARIERRVALLLLALGPALLLAFATEELLVSAAHPVVKIGFVATLTGALLLVVSVARAWLRTRRLDRYQGVRR